MKTLLNFTKLTTMLLIGILAGYAIYVSFNTNKYFKNCEAPIHTSQEAHFAPIPSTEVEKQEYVEDAPLIDVEERNWIDHKATF